MSEIVHGTTKKLKINKLVACEPCGGSGAFDKDSYATCTQCGGSGQMIQIVNTIFGRQQAAVTCPSCNGAGKTIKKKCASCSGSGTIKKEEVVEINIPAGVGEGMQLSVSGKGNAARNSGINGDLLVLIEEEPHPELERQGNDLIYTLVLNIADAILGSSIEIPDVDGKVKIKIDPGTQAGKVLRLRGKGIPDVNGRGKGDILVVVDVFMPSHISPAEKETLKKIQSSDNFKPKSTPGGQNLFERMKNYFMG